MQWVLGFKNKALQIVALSLLIGCLFKLKRVIKKARVCEFRGLYQTFYNRQTLHVLGTYGNN